MSHPRRPSWPNHVLPDGVVVHVGRNSVRIISPTPQGSQPQQQQQQQEEEEGAAALIAFSDESVRRGVRFHLVLRGGSRVLADSAGSANTFKLSQPTLQIHTFFSHNWAVSRHLKYMVLVLYFNLSTAVAAAGVTLAVTIALSYCELAPTYDCGGLYRQGILAMGVAMPLFFLVLFFGHELRPRGPIVFLDKVCIHQTDAKLKEHGIRSLGAFVCSSQHLLICYTDLYLQKLWTVYELATFLVVCSSEGEHSRKAHLVPVSFASFVLLSSLLCFLVVASEHVLAFTAHNLAVLLVLRTLLFVGMIAVVARRWARQQSRTQELMDQFSFDRAHCSNEADRALVAGNIVALMRHYKLVEETATREEVLEYLDDYVRRAVPRMLQTSVGRAGLPYQYLVPLALVLYADQVDRIMPSEVATRWTVVDYLATSTRCFGVLPIVVAVTLSCTRRCLRVTGWAEVAFCAAVALCAAILFAVLDPHDGLVLSRVHDAAITGDDTMLGILLLYQLVIAAVTLAIYRPLAQDLLKLEAKPAETNAAADNVLENNIN